MLDLLRKGALRACLAACAFGGVALSAQAADLPYKAAPPPAPVTTLDIHGFFDLSFKNAYITPRGLLVTNTGLTTQILSGLVFNLYKDPNGAVNNISFVAGIWNDLWSQQNHPQVGPWNEFDYFFALNFTLFQQWKFGVQYVEFLSPTGAFVAEKNIEFSLAYDDSKTTFLPIPLNPYVKLFWAVAGDSTVVTGKRGDTYDVELGIVPTIDLNKVGVPVVLTVPTWVTVGPSTYWNRGLTGCGPAAGSPCAASNAGVISTGLTAKSPLPFMPANLGKWYGYAGFQYYHLLNDSLLLAQTFTGTAASYQTAHRDIVVGFAGLGFTF